MSSVFVTILTKNVLAGLVTSVTTCGRRATQRRRTMPKREYTTTQEESVAARKTLKRWLLKKKIRLTDRPAIADALGVSEGTVYNILSGEKEISPENLMRIARAISGGGPVFAMFTETDPGGSTPRKIEVEPEFDIEEEMNSLLTENDRLRAELLKTREKLAAVHAAIGAPFPHTGLEDKARALESRHATSHPSSGARGKSAPKSGR
jgi:transcriptional regulator with XRE-family HTH domain